FAMLTAYDYLSAKILDEAGIPILLVGDSLGMVMLGHPTTLPVTLDDMLHHAKAVARGAKQALLVGDMPFMSYHASVEQAITHALRIPTIGIGAGPATDGQVLVLHDMLGLTSGKAPKFVKRYANLAEEIARAATAYADDVRDGKFPGPEHEYSANGSAPTKDREEVRYGG